MKYARIINNFAVDVRIESPEGFFHPDVAAQFSTVPDSVEDGWVIENGVWSAPPTPESPAPAPTYKKVSPVEFKLLFTPQERVAIKAARATDPIIDDFYDIVEDPRLTYVDLGLDSVQAALQYLTSAGFLAAGRADQIIQPS